MPERIAQFITIGGRVQGVGFRPFVYRLAQQHQITGWVRNVDGAVEIHAEGQPVQLQRFSDALLSEAPPLSAPGSLAITDCAAEPAEAFSILDSATSREADIHLPPDGFVCADCLAELHDPANRRHRYPFINCTQCGPRYTLITALPYDRPNTAMRDFALCPDCRQEYENPLDRRFHAEPIACPVCGPHLQFISGEETHDGDEAALNAAVAALRAGKIVAVKGVGGYHLLCDATNNEAIAALRARKPRPSKPLAVMFRNLEALRRAVHIPPGLDSFLASPERPIVLLQKRADSRLSGHIAPGLAEIGCLLPYSPLHDLLLNDFGGPLIATSGNLSGEPVLTDNTEAQSRLPHLADAFLHHDRPIVRPADDSVVRIAAGRARPIRLGRGIAPLELDLPEQLPEPVLAVGGHLKLTVALAWGKRVVISPHVGDMGTRRSELVFEQVARDLQRLYDVRATRWLCDAHPGYTTTRWVQSLGQPFTTVLHHHAHASAIVAEHGVTEPAIVFAWDGVGYGGDGTLWGGEAFVGRPGHWQRRASLRSFRLPGGDKAGRSPWRSAAALCWEAGMECPVPVPDPIVRAAWERGINAPQSSAAGRVFDALSAIVLGVAETSFEGQGPMWLEACARPVERFPCLPIEPDQEGVLRIDWAPLLEYCSEQGRSVAERAGAAHAALADAIGRVAEAERSRSGATVVGLTGGVFQNRLLLESAAARLERSGFRVLLPGRIPCNDGGLSYGQVAEHLGRTAAAAS